MDGASGWPIAERGQKTSLELAHTPNLDRMAEEGTVGLVCTVPEGMEPSSACACMSVLGYDPKVYYRGRSAIEARSMGIPIADGEVVFRCNLVAVRDAALACVHRIDPQRLRVRFLHGVHVVERRVHALHRMMTDHH